jgi:splicing factor 3B subunit 2
LFINTHRPGAAGGAPDVEVTLSPEELEGLDNEGIRALYEAKMAAAQQAAKAEREDFSDMVARHAAAQKRKIAERAETRAAKKQKDSFKF